MSESGDPEEVVIEASDVGEMPAELLAEGEVEDAEARAEGESPREGDEEEAGEEAGEEEVASEEEEVIEALNEDGTALDQYDPETLAHIGSESVVRAATDEDLADWRAELLAAETERAAELEEAAPNEPDPPQEQTGPEDPQGIVTALSPVAFAKLQEVWKSRGNPHQFDYQASRWSSYDNGEKFVRTGGQGSMDQFYGSLSLG